MFNINLQNDKYFVCNEDETILFAALKENVNLNYSCQDGRCQSCKTKVLKGTSIANKEETGLSLEEKKDGYILTCVRIPTSDLYLEVEDLSEYTLEKTRTIPAKVDSLHQISTDVIALHLRIPPNTNFKYLPGQYVDIVKGDYKRSYSIANNGSSANLVFYIKNYPQGRFSQYLFNEAKLNDLLRIEGPFGTFFYRKTQKKNIIFLATGTGIAPVKAMLEEMNSNVADIQDKQIYLFFGGRTQKDLFWKPEFGDLKIDFIPVLSKIDGDWMGEKGYIQDVLISKSIDLSDAIVYACGSENMIKDSNRLLIQHGLSDDSFHSDAFVSTNKK